MVGGEFFEMALVLFAAYAELGLEGLEFFEVRLADLAGTSLLVGDALKALGQRTVSRAEELGLGVVTDGHVGSARLRMGV